MAKAYEVISIDQLSRVSDTRGIEPFYRHRIRTKERTVLSVDIDQEDFTPGKTDKILTEAATNADTILKQ